MLLPYILFILYPVSAVLTLFLAILGWHNRNKPISQPFVLLMVATTIWTIGDWLTTLTSDPIKDYFINSTIYPAVVTVPVAWLMVILYYMGYEHYLTKRIITLLFAIPAINVILVITNPSHLLFYSEITPEIFYNLIIWHYNHGVLFPITVFYSYLLILSGSLLILTRLFGLTDIYRKQTIILFFASLIPFACNMIYVISSSLHPTMDLTPFSFTIVGILLALGIFRYKLFSSVPLAYASLFTGIRDGVFATDTTFHIIDLNPAAIQICGLPSEKAIGSLIQNVIPEAGTPGMDLNKQHEGTKEIKIIRRDSELYYELSYYPLSSGMNNHGYIFTFRDITVRKNAQELLEKTNKKMNLLSSITRHDILNQVSGLYLYLTFSLEKNTDMEIDKYLKACESIVGTIQSQIEFTRIYEEIGLNNPKWQNLSLILRKVKNDLPNSTLNYHSDLEGLMIYADPLLEKVFFTLVENSIRHGGKVTDVKFSYVINESDLTLFYEDNGTGIAKEDKSRIFDKKFGKNTGFGLFLAKEVLYITGMSIKETGIKEIGVRFEIFVPRGAWRLHSE